MAFPTTPIIDSFIYDQNPLALATDGTAWSTKRFQGQVSPLLKATGGGCQGLATTADQFLVGRVDGPNCECYVGTTAIGSNQFFFGLRATNLGTGSVNSFEIDVVPGGSNSRVQIGRNLSGAFSNLTQSSAFTIADGDAFGVSVIGTLITAYRRPVGGVWTVVASSTNTTASLQGPGSFYLGLDATDTIIDLLGGGTIPVGAMTTPAHSVSPAILG